jgi:hypothetical protein
MTKTITLRVAGILSLATLTLLALPHEGDLTLAFVLAVLAFFVGLSPVRLPLLKIRLTPTHPFLLAALPLAGPQAAVAVALVGVLGATLGARRAPGAHRLLFNVGNVALATGLAALAFGLAGGSMGSRFPALFAPLAAAATVFFIVNSVLLAWMVAFTKSQPLLATWRRSFAWSSSAYLAGFPLAAALVFLYQQWGTGALALGLPPALLLIAFYRSYRDRMESDRRRLEEVEGLNRQLRITVAELRERVAQLRRLEDIIAICMHCKKVRVSEDTWSGMESYFEEHTDVRFTHTICQCCLERHYAGYGKRDDLRDD